MIKERRNNIKTDTLLAIILIVIEIVAFAYQDITYTSREKIVDPGPFELTTEKTRTVPLPPIVGGSALVGGILLLLIGSKRLDYKSKTS